MRGEENNGEERKRMERSGKEWREEEKNPIPPGKNPARSRTQAFDILRLLTE